MAWAKRAIRVTLPMPTPISCNAAMAWAELNLDKKPSAPNFLRVGNSQVSGGVYSLIGVGPSKAVPTRKQWQQCKSPTPMNSKAVVAISQSVASRLARSNAPLMSLAPKQIA